MVVSNLREMCMKFLFKILIVLVIPVLMLAALAEGEVVGKHSRIVFKLNENVQINVWSYMKIEGEGHVTRLAKEGELVKFENGATFSVKNGVFEVNGKIYDFGKKKVDGVVNFYLSKDGVLTKNVYIRTFK